MKKTEAKKRPGIPAIIGIVAAVVLVIAFCSYHIYMNVKGSELKTEIAFADSWDKSLAVDMFVVRDERIVTTRGANVVSAVKDGTRVGINDTVAYSFADSASAGNIIRMGEINELLDYYGDLLASSASVVSDTTAYDERIMNDLYSFADAVSSGDLSELDSHVSELRDAITSRQTATGIELDLSESINALQAEYDSLKASTGSYSQIVSDGTGYYISGSDGYENVLDYNAVDEWTIEDVENALATEEMPVDSNAAGRLVHGYYWYLTCVIDTADVPELEDKSRYTISFPDSSVQDITVQIYEIRSDYDSEKSLVIFTCNSMNEELASLRSESAVITVTECEGFRVNNDAVRSDENDQKGVYIVEGGKMYFKRILVLASTEDYSIVANPYEVKEIRDKDEEDLYLHLYDEYITDGRDLSDGKILQ